jgi:hypothetical protein
MWRLVLCVLTSCALPGTVLAQGGRPPVQEGDRIRVSAESASGVYFVLGLNGDTVALQGPFDAVATHLPLNSIRRLEISRGPRSVGRGALRGAGRGLAVGAGIGIAAGLISGDDEAGLLAFSAEEKALVFAILLGGPGAVVGGIIGGAWPGERWERVALHERVGLSTTRTGALALSYNLRF